MAKFLTRQDILAIDDLPREKVHVKEWSGNLYVRGMTGQERDQWDELNQKRKREDGTFNLDNSRAELLSLVLTDENGNRLFSNKDIEALGKKSAIPINFLFDIAQRLCGFGDKNIDKFTKN